LRPHSRLRRLSVFGLLLVAACLAALWSGKVPARFSPLAPLNLADKDPWFLDFRLAALNDDAPLCAAVMTPPLVAAAAVPDKPVVAGCGWTSAVRLDRAAGVHVGAATLNCSQAAALTLWLLHSVQPAAEELLGARVTGLQNMGTYACRNIVGSQKLKAFRSQHARANAIDVSAFVLEDGRTVSVSKHWRASGPEGVFLHRVHDASCGYFRVSLGPDFNSAHSNHFHLDRGLFKSCR